MATGKRYTKKILCGIYRRKLDRLKKIKDYKAVIFLTHAVEDCMVWLIKKDPEIKPLHCFLKI